MTRNRLNNRRYSETDVMYFNGIPITMTVGVNEHGEIGEVFLNVQKAAGSQIDVAARDVAILVSLGLQHGAPLRTIRDALTRDANGNVEGLAGVLLETLMEMQQQYETVGE